MSASTTQAVRIRPVPRSEPLTDEERRDSGLAGTSARSPVADCTLPPDLATGVRVRRGARSRGANGSAEGAPAAPATDPTSEPPAVLRAPDMVLAVVTAPLHMPGPPRDESPPPQATTEAPAAVAPGLTRARGDDTPVPSVGARELRFATRRLLGACVEVIAGFRPVTQLRPYCAPERFDAIVNRLLRPVGTGRGHGATRASVIARSIAPPRPGRPGHPPPQDRVIVRRVRICDVMEGVAELAVVMSRHGKIWGMALRMERSRGRWQCMHMEVL